MSSRTELALAVAALVAVLLFVGFYKPHTANAPAVSPSRLVQIPSKDISLFPSLIPSLFTPTSTFEGLVPRIETSTTTVKNRTFTQVIITPPKISTTTAPSATTTKPVLVQPDTPQVASSAPSTLRGTLVNVLCISHKAPLRGTSGSGVFIDSKGVILTVAHVAQAVLLSEELGNNVLSCTIRTGTPATNAYRAKVLYISDAWLHKNPTTLISSQPMGTGENDIGLLAVTSTVSGAPLPTSFPALSLSSEELSVGDEVQLGGYGAQYLSSSDVRTNLAAIFSRGPVTSLYTFHSSTQDVISVLGGKVAQEGSSGGGGTDDAGKLIGIITTSDISGDFADRHVRLITPLHIRSSFEDEMGQSLESYLSRASVSALLSSYQPKVSVLGSFLAHAIGME